MTRNSRIALLTAAAVVAVVAVVIIGTGGNDDGKGSSPAQTAAAGGGAATQPTATPKPAIPAVTVRGGEPVGGVRTIAAKSGERARFEVKSDADHEIHLHGFDLAKDVKAGGSVTFDVQAQAPGIYEFEIEDTGTKIGQVKVEP